MSWANILDIQTDVKRNTFNISPSHSTYSYSVISTVFYIRIIFLILHSSSASLFIHLLILGGIIFKSGQNNRSTGHAMPIRMDIELSRRRDVLNQTLEWSCSFLSVRNKEFIWKWEDQENETFYDLLNQFRLLIAVMCLNSRFSEKINWIETRSKLRG